MIKSTGVHIRDINTSVPVFQSLFVTTGTIFKPERVFCQRRTSGVKTQLLKHTGDAYDASVTIL